MKENIEKYGSLNEIKKAYDAVGRGNRYVYIFKIRRHLNWQRAQFDEMMHNLMVEGFVMAHPGNPGELTSEEITDSYRDLFGDLMISVTWEGPA